MKSIDKLFRAVKLRTDDNTANLVGEKLRYLSVLSDRGGCKAIAGFRKSGRDSVLFKSSYLSAENTRLAYEAQVEVAHTSVMWEDIANN